MNIIAVDKCHKKIVDKFGNCEATKICGLLLIIYLKKKQIQISHKQNSQRTPVLTS